MPNDNKAIIIYTEVIHNDKKAFIYNYGGNGKLKIAPIEASGFDSGIPCEKGQSDPGACPPGWTAVCIDGTWHCNSQG